MPTAHLIDPAAVEEIGLFGPTLRILSPLDGDDDAPSVMHGTVPAGAVVPLHSHADPETFLARAGELEGLAGELWTRIPAGTIFHVPGGARHAFRNRSAAPAELTIVSTVRIARFFLEVATPPGAEPTPEALEHFQRVSARYGYWNATPEENDRVLRIP